MTRPDIGAEALDLYRRLTTMTEAEGVNWLTMKLGILYQQGVVDGLAKADEAVKAAFQRAKP